MDGTEGGEEWISVCMRMSRALNHTQGSPCKLLFTAAVVSVGRGWRDSRKKVWRREWCDGPSAPRKPAVLGSYLFAHRLPHHVPNLRLRRFVIHLKWWWSFNSVQSILMAACRFRKQLYDYYVYFASEVFVWAASELSSQCNFVSFGGFEEEENCAMNRSDVHFPFRESPKLYNNMFPPSLLSRSLLSWMLGFVVMMMLPSNTLSLCCDPLKRVK